MQNLTLPSSIHQREKYQKAKAMMMFRAKNGPYPVPLGINYYIEPIEKQTHDPKTPDAPTEFRSRVQFPSV